MDTTTTKVIIDGKEYNLQMNFTPVAVAAPTPVPAQVTAPLIATINVNGKVYIADESTGKNLGNFTSSIGGFTHKCIRVDIAELSMSVFFRSDTNGNRDEVVFELGRCFSGTPAALGAYTTTITRGATTLATVAITEHYWFSRWRWQSTPRPIVGTISDLITKKYLPAFNTSTTPVTYTYVGKYSPMGLSGITAYMTSTGERDDIGLVTEPQGIYICTNNANALSVVMAQGESGATMPWHMRDENTSAPISFETYPKASWYDNTSGSPAIKRVSCPVSLDSAHMPALMYLPYLLTGDSYYLEALQFQSNWNWGACSTSYRPTNGQTRQLAWDIRTLAQVSLVTPASVPSWLLPQSYWKTRLDVFRNFVAVLSTLPDNLASVFYSGAPIGSSPDQGPGIAQGTWVSPWEEEFFASVMGWVVSMGFTDWAPNFNWKIKSTLARTNNSSGWVRAQCTPYRLILKSTASSATLASWSEAFALTKTRMALTYTDPNTWANTSDETYLGYTRGSLYFAELLNPGSSGDSFNWATTQLKNSKWNLSYKWRIGSGI